MTDFPWKPHPKQIEFLERETDVIFTSTYIHGSARGAFSKEMFQKFRRVMKYENGQNLPRIENNFKYHPPIAGQTERYEEIRDKAKELAYLINGSTPASREQSEALTCLENTVMWANAAIARNE